MGADPAAFIDIFEAGHWFDIDSLTQEDLGRASAYAARAAAQAEAAQATDVGAYLRSLKMKGRLYRPDEADIARVAQLELKTNQFNTTTRRFTEAQIRSFLERRDAVVLAFRLADKFGDHGLTSTLIAVVDGDSLRIESWLMSCRIFSRSAEAFILRGLLIEARRLGVQRAVGLYEPTAKNGVVADLFVRLGFAALDDGSFSRDLAAGVDDLETQIDG
jgi:FkbH-like protein